MGLPMSAVGLVVSLQAVFILLHPDPLRLWWSPSSPMQPRKDRADGKKEVSPFFSYCFATCLSYAIAEYLFSFHVIFGHVLQ